MSSKIQALRNLRYWKTLLFLSAKLSFPTKMHFERLSFFSYRWRWLQALEVAYTVVISILWYLGVVMERLMCNQCLQWEDMRLKENLRLIVVSSSHASSCVYTWPAVRSNTRHDDRNEFIAQLTFILLNKI